MSIPAPTRPGLPVWAIVLIVGALALVLVLGIGVAGLLLMRRGGLTPADGGETRPSATSTAARTATPQEVAIGRAKQQNQILISLRAAITSKGGGKVTWVSIDPELDSAYVDLDNKAYIFMLGSLTENKEQKALPSNGVLDLAAITLDDIEMLNTKAFERYSPRYEVSNGLEISYVHGGTSIAVRVTDPASKQQAGDQCTYVVRYVAKRVDDPELRYEPAYRSEQPESC